MDIITSYNYPTLYYKCIYVGNNREYLRRGETNGLVIGANLKW